MWFAGYQAYYLGVLSILPAYYLDGGSFFSGIVFMISGSVFGLLCLIFYYLIAELIIVIINMANNLKAVRQALETQEITTINK